MVKVIVEPDESELPDLGINPEKVCHVIVKARAFDVKEAPADEDSGSNPDDDGMTDVLEDLPGGRTRLTERLRASVEASENQLRARPLMRMALFAFLKSQLEGVKERAEGTIGPRDEGALAA